MKVAAAKLRGGTGDFLNPGKNVTTTVTASSQCRRVPGFVLANPDVVNSRSGPSLPLDWKTRHSKGAQLAPNLQQNPAAEAAFFVPLPQRVTKDFNAVAAPEAWRLPQHHDPHVRFSALLKFFGLSDSTQAHQTMERVARGTQHG